MPGYSHCYRQPLHDPSSLGAPHRRLDRLLRGAPAAECSSSPSIDCIGLELHQVAPLTFAIATASTGTASTASIIAAIVRP